MPRNFAAEWIERAGVDRSATIYGHPLRVINALDDSGCDLPPPSHYIMHAPLFVNEQEALENAVAQHVRDWPDDAGRRALYVIVTGTYSVAESALASRDDCFGPRPLWTRWLPAGQ